MNYARTFLILLIFHNSYAQAPAQNGWFFGAATGVSTIHLSTSGLTDDTQTTLSFPNIRVGKMLTERSAILLYLPGTIYRYKGSGRERDRGFEGIVPGFQYWIANRWWVLAGAGLTFDAPAFYDIRKETERTFYFGPSFLGATGYEIWKKKRFVLNIQGRIHYGFATIPEGRRTGLAGNLMIGFNWYIQRDAN